VAGGRTKTVSVGLTEAEYDELQIRAKDLGMTVPRLLFETTMASNAISKTEFKALIAELFTVTRRISEIALDFRKIAGVAQAKGEFPEEALVAALECRAAVFMLHQTVRKVATLN
jgi:hypothetical protein